MKLLRLSTQIHKWVALVIGLQVLFWVGGGLVMTAIPIETVRSEHRVQKPDYPAFAIDALVPVQTAAAGLSPRWTRPNCATPRAVRPGS